VLFVVRGARIMLQHFGFGGVQGGCAGSIVSIMINCLPRPAQGSVRTRGGRNLTPVMAWFHVQTLMALSTKNFWKYFISSGVTVPGDNPG
jgi:hypothetical protein